MDTRELRRRSSQVGSPTLTKRWLIVCRLNSTAPSYKKPHGDNARHWGLDPKFPHQRASSVVRLYGEQQVILQVQVCRTDRR